MGDDYNKDELVSPEWMDREFFENVMRKCENNQTVKVTKFVIRPASKIGEHYLSVMYRVLVTYELDSKQDASHNKSLIIKIMPFVDGEKKESVEQLNIFETEIKMYTEVIPTFEKILRENGDDMVFGAKIYYSSLDPLKIIIFEDLTEAKYETISGWGDTDDVTKLAIRKLARWHAISYKLNAEHKGIYKNFKDSLWTSPMMQVPTGMMYDGITNFYNMVKNLEGYEHYAEKFEKFLDGNFVRSCVRYGTLSEDEHPCKLFVLNHGDFHSKNLMYGESSKGNDVKLIDFQISFWGCAAIDIFYMLYMVIRPSCRLNNRDEILYYYFSNFTQTLDLIKYEGDRPQLIDLQTDLLKCKELEIFMFTTILPMTYLIMKPEETKTDLSDMVHSANVRTNAYGRADYIEDVKATLPTLLYKGFLD